MICFLAMIYTTAMGGRQVKKIPIGIDKPFAVR
jgi:hypothetical protein